MTQHTVKAAHQASYPTALTMQAGDCLEAVRRDSDWPGWVWCIAPDGTGAWVPEVYLDIQGNRAQALRNYSSAELSVSVGDEVTVEDELAGWFWVKDKAGNYGWIPIQSL
jgi:hypothetical protein